MSKIGVFDSGYGGLTVLKSLVNALPEMHFVYLGDNARAPYGDRSFDTVYHYTRDCVNWLFDHDCDLVILACNTASAKALRQIQQVDLPKRTDYKRVLGVIRPTTESVGDFTQSQHIGILGTQGTVKSESYKIEIAKFFPSIHVTQEACPIWVHLVENNLLGLEGTDFFVNYHIQRLMAADNQIDAIFLACTHYPLLLESILKAVPPTVKVVSQGDLVAQKLVDYLNRHPELATKLLKDGQREFFTTDQFNDFDSQAGKFYGEIISAKRVEIPQKIEHS
jgi:glutamate racemase